MTSVGYCYLTIATDSIDELLYEHISGMPHPSILKRQADEKKRKLKEKRKAEEYLKKDNKRKGNYFPIVLNKEATKKGEKTIGTAIESGADEDEFFGQIFKKNEKQEIKFCWECQVDVLKTSMHCNHCNKCVSHFDHHCVWFNTCIGSENYVTFCRSILWLTLFKSFHLATIILYAFSYFTDLWNVRMQSEWLGGGFPKIVLGVNMAVGVLIFLIILIIIQLVMFHQKLRKKEMTTYQFTLMSSNLKREKRILNNQVKERRELELSRLRTVGGSINQIVCMQIGGMKLCRPCDPVKRMLHDEQMNLDDNAALNSDDIKKTKDLKKKNGTIDENSSSLYNEVMKKTSSFLGLLYDESDDHPNNRK